MAEDHIMTIGIELVESLASFTKKVNAGIASHLNKRLRSKHSYITSRVRGYVQMWVRAQPELLDLATNYGTAGSLASQLGFTYGSSRGVADLVAVAVAASVEVHVQKFDSNLNGGVFVKIQPRDFANLVGIGGASIPIAGGSLPWLEWLLQEGHTTLIVGYEYNPQTGLGRSKAGNMKAGGSWRVPPQYAGTADSNFITRALVGPAQAKDITRIFKAIFR